MHPSVGAIAPAVELQLEIQRVREPPTGLEVRAHEPMRSLQCTLGLRVTRVEDDPADTQLPAETGELIGRPAAPGDRRLAVPHQLLRQRADPPQAPADTPQDVRRLLAEDQRASDHARPAQLGGHHPPAPGLAVTDRHQLARLPQIALDQLPRPIDGPLERATDPEPWTDLAHEVVEDRLASRIAQLDRHLPQPQRLNAWVRAQLLADPVLKRIKLRPRRRPRIPRRRLAGNGPGHRVTSQTSQPRDLTLRAPLDQHQPPDLGPLLHADHTPLLARPQRSREAQRPAGQRPATAPWPSLQPARLAEYSRGAHSDRSRAERGAAA